VGGLVNPVIFRAGHYSFWNYIGINRTHEQDIKNVVITLSERVLRKRERYMRNKLFLSYWNNKVMFMANDTVLVRLNFYNSKKEVWWVWRAYVLEKEVDLRFVDKSLNVLGGVLKIKMQGWLKSLAKRGEAIYNKINLHPAVFGVRRRFYSIVRLEKYQAYFRAERIKEVIEQGLYAHFVRKNYEVRSKEGDYVKMLQTWHSLYITKGLYKMKKTFNRVLKKRINKRRGEALHMVEGLYKRNRNHSFLTTFLVLGFSQTLKPTQYFKNKFLYFGECFLGLNPLYNKYYINFSHEWLSLTLFIKKNYYKFKRRDNLYSELRVDLNRMLFQSFYNRQEKKRQSIETLLQHYMLKDIRISGEVSQHYQTSLKYFVKKMHSYSLLQFPKLFQVAMCVSSKVKSGVIADLHNFKTHKKKFKKKYATRFRLNLCRLLVKSLGDKISEENRGRKGIFALVIKPRVNFTSQPKLRKVYSLIQSTRIKNILQAQNYTLSRYKSLVLNVLTNEEKESEKSKKKQLKEDLTRKTLHQAVKAFLKKQKKYAKSMWRLRKPGALTSKNFKIKLLESFYPLSYKTKLTKKNIKKKMDDKVLKALIKTKPVYVVKKKATYVEKLAKRMTPADIAGLPLSTQEFIKNARNYETPEEEMIRKSEEKMVLEARRSQRFKLLIRYFIRRGTQSLDQIALNFTTRELLVLKKLLRGFFLPKKLLKIKTAQTVQRMEFHQLFPKFFPKKKVDTYMLIFYKKLKKRQAGNFVNKVLAAEWESVKSRKPVIWWFLRLKKTAMFQKKNSYVYYACLNSVHRKKEYLLLQKKIISNGQGYFKLQQIKFFQKYVGKSAWLKTVFKTLKKCRKKRNRLHRHVYLKRSERYRFYRVKTSQRVLAGFKLRQQQHSEMRKHYNILLLNKFKQLLNFFRNQKILINMQNKSSLDTVVNKFIYINQTIHKIVKLCNKKVPLGFYKKIGEAQEIFAKVRRYHDVYTEFGYRLYKKGKREKISMSSSVRWFPRAFSPLELKKQEKHYKIQHIQRVRRETKTFKSYDLFILRLLKYFNKYSIERQYPLFSTFVFKLFLNKFFHRKKIWNKYVGKIIKNLQNYKKKLILSLYLKNKEQHKLKFKLSNFKYIKKFYLKKMKRRAIEVSSFTRKRFYKNMNKKQLKFMSKKRLPFLLRHLRLGVTKNFLIKSVILVNRFNRLRNRASSVAPEKIDELLKHRKAMLEKAEKIRNLLIQQKKEEKEERRKRYLRQKKFIEEQKNKVFYEAQNYNRKWKKDANKKSWNTNVNYRNDNKGYNKDSQRQDLSTKMGYNKSQKKEEDAPISWSEWAAQMAKKRIQNENEAMVKEDDKILKQNNNLKFSQNSYKQSNNQGGWNLNNYYNGHVYKKDSSRQDAPTKLEYDKNAEKEKEASFSWGEWAAQMAKKRIQNENEAMVKEDDKNLKQNNNLKTSQKSYNQGEISFNLEGRKVHNQYNGQVSPRQKLPIKVKYDKSQNVEKNKQFNKDEWAIMVGRQRIQLLKEVFSKKSDEVPNPKQKLDSKKSRKSKEQNELVLKNLEGWKAPNQVNKPTDNKQRRIEADQQRGWKAPNQVNKPTDTNQRRIGADQQRGWKAPNQVNKPTDNNQRRIGADQQRGWKAPNQVNKSTDNKQRRIEADQQSGWKAPNQVNKPTDNNQRRIGADQQRGWKAPNQVNKPTNNNQKKDNVSAPRRYFVTKIKNKHKTSATFTTQKKIMWIKGSTGAKKLKLKTFYRSLWDVKPQKALNFLFKKLKYKKKLIKRVPYKVQKHKSILKLINNKRDKSRLIKKRYKNYYYYKLKLCVFLNSLKNLLKRRRQAYYFNTSTATTFLRCFKKDVLKKWPRFKVVRKPGKPYKTLSNKQRCDCVGLIMVFIINKKKK